MNSSGFYIKYSNVYSSFYFCINLIPINTLVNKAYLVKLLIYFIYLNNLYRLTFV